MTAPQLLQLSVKVNKSSPKSFGKSASPPLTAENGLVRCVC